jgi:hypothetical protein
MTRREAGFMEYNEDVTYGELVAALAVVGCSQQALEYMRGLKVKLAYQRVGDRSEKLVCRYRAYYWAEAPDGRLFEGWREKTNDLRPDGQQRLAFQKAIQREGSLLKPEYWDFFCAEIDRLTRHDAKNRALRDLAAYVVGPHEFHRDAVRPLLNTRDRRGPMGFSRSEPKG